VPPGIRWSRGAAREEDASPDRSSRRIRVVATRSGALELGSVPDEVEAVDHAGELKQAFDLRGALGDISHLSDNVILLQFVRPGSQLLRAVTVLKTRASRHEPDVREFRITPKGIVLGEPLDDPAS
jgi:KaiC